MPNAPKQPPRSPIRHIPGIAGLLALMAVLWPCAGNAQLLEAPAAAAQPSQPGFAETGSVQNPPTFPNLPPAPPVAPSVPASPRFAIGANLMQPAIYGLASSFFDNSYFISLPIEGHVSIDSQWGLATTFVYLKHKDGDYRVSGLQLGLGPRLTLVGDGLRGLYSSFKVGLGFRAGHDYREDNYYRLDVTFAPEIGYSLAWGPPGCFLAFGMGVQLQKPISEESHPTWGWNGLGRMVNYYLPVVNITLGYGG